MKRNADKYMFRVFTDKMENNTWAYIFAILEAIECILSYTALSSIWQFVLTLMFPRSATSCSWTIYRLSLELVKLIAIFMIN